MPKSRLTHIIMYLLQKGTAAVGNSKEGANGWGDCKPDVGRRPEVHGLGALLEHVNVRILNIEIIFQTLKLKESKGIQQIVYVYVSVLLLSKWDSVCGSCTRKLELLHLPAWQSS